jgi:sorbitol-specific phosphotransferase system component IIC
MATTISSLFTTILSGLLPLLIQLILQMFAV